MPSPRYRSAAVAAGFFAVSLLVAGTASAMVATPRQAPIATAVELQQEDPKSETAPVSTPVSTSPPKEVGLSAIKCDPEAGCIPLITVEQHDPPLSEADAVAGTGALPHPERSPSTRDTSFTPAHSPGTPHTGDRGACTWPAPDKRWSHSGSSPGTPWEKSRAKCDRSAESGPDKPRPKVRDNSGIEAKQHGGKDGPRAGSRGDHRDRDDHRDRKPGSSHPYGKNTPHDQWRERGD